MDFLKAKMDLSFPSHPLIYLWIESAFDMCVTEYDFMDFVSDCLEKSEDSKNPIRKEAYRKSAHVVYAKLTGSSLESYNKIIQQCQNKN